METGQIIGFVLVGLFIYYLMMNFTYGVKLYPRERDRLGVVIKHPLHTWEAFFWPIAWAILVSYLAFWYLGWWLNWIGSAASRIGQKVGSVEPPIGPQVQRRFENFQRQPNQH